MKVLIVDDEPAIRNGLAKFVHWKKIGIEEVYKAESAEDAWKLMEEQKPDIILSDIRMPGMSGIELGELIREKGYDCRIILISGYSDREYYKKAIQISVEDYIEKPVDIAIVEECLMKVVEKCIQDRERRKKETEVQNFIKERGKNVHRIVLEDLLHGRRNDTVLNLLPELEKFWDKQFICMIFRISDKGNEAEDRMQKLTECVENLLGDIQHLYEVKDGCYLVWLMMYTKDEYLHHGYHALQQLKEKVYSGRLGEGKVFLTCSNTGKGFASVPELYCQATALQQQLFFQGWNRYVENTETDKNRKISDHIPLDDWTKELVMENYDGVKKAAEEIYRYIRNKNDTLPAIVKNVYYEMNCKLNQRICLEKDMVSRDETVEKGVLWDKINSFETLEECQKYLLETVSAIQENRRGYLSDNKQIVDIIKYIQRHFKEPDLSIGKIADTMFLSSAYLSFFFKKQTGKNITEVIRDYRLDYSIVLLKDRSKSLQEVAVESGYSSQNYYAKVFRGKYGLSPSDYREKNI